MKQLIFVTGNKNKLAEAKKILSDFEIINQEIDLPEFQGSPEFIVKEKARLAFKKLNKPCFVEDTSLSFKEWNGLPGPYIKDFIKLVGVDKLFFLLEGKDHFATAVSSIGYADEKGLIHCFQGEILGEIVSAGGEDRFDWDRIFKPQGYNKRFSEMTMEEKNKISHRKRAFEEFKKFLIEKLY